MLFSTQISENAKKYPLIKPQKTSVTQRDIIFTFYMERNRFQKVKTDT